MSRVPIRVTALCILLSLTKIEDNATLLDGSFIVGHTIISQKMNLVLSVVKQESRHLNYRSCKQTMKIDEVGKKWALWVSFWLWMGASFTCGTQQGQTVSTLAPPTQQIILSLVLVIMAVFFTCLAFLTESS